MRQLTINVCEEDSEFFKELVKRFGGQIASEKQVDDEHVDVFERARLALRILNEEGVIKRKGDYAYIYKLIDKGHVKGLGKFDSTKSFLLFLKEMGVKDLPGCTTIDEAYKKIDGRFPNWKFTDTDDPGRTIRRINVGNRFLSVMNKGF